jgi:hypothetical protein
MASREGCLHFVFDQSERLREGGFYIQIGRIQQDGVLSLPEWSNGAGPVPMISRDQVCLDGFDVRYDIAQTLLRLR